MTADVIRIERCIEVVENADLGLLELVVILLWKRLTLDALQSDDTVFTFGILAEILIGAFTQLFETVGVTQLDFATEADLAGQIIISRHLY